MHQEPRIIDTFLESYSTVFIGYPIWWGEAPRIMSTFVESHSFDGKTVIPFCTSGSSPIGRSGSDLASQAAETGWQNSRKPAKTYNKQSVTEAASVQQETGDSQH